MTIKPATRQGVIPLNEQSAAVAYDNAARSVWGELATLNFGGAQ